MENNKDKIFVGGDLSGIQKFIYNITSYKAAVSLRGRSAWLADYMNEVCDKLCKLLPASPQTEKIYCSGGKFFIITLDTDEVRNTIDSYQRKVEQELWEKHNGQLALSICYVPFSSTNNEDTVTTANVVDAPFTRLFDEVNALFALKKNRKFLSVIQNHHSDFFDKQMVGGKTKVCAITGIEDSSCVEFGKDKDNTYFILPSVAEQIKKGLELRDDDYKGETFESYANESYLGVLRMDVDNLGAKFRSLKTKHAYKQFSDRLDSFFGSKSHPKSTLKEIAAKYKGDLCIVYSGGDDIFVVGHWNRVIEFAAEVRAKFNDEFQKDGVTLSGGIAIVKVKFPIAKAAELAGDAEEASKHFNGGEKNAFTMLGVTVSWKEYIDDVYVYKKRFVELCSPPYNMPRSILHRIMELNEIRKQDDQRYLWNTAYFLKRFAEGKNNAIKDFCLGEKDEGLQKKLLNNRNYELIALACRWAELELRQ